MSSHIHRVLNTIFPERTVWSSPYRRALRDGGASRQQHQRHPSIVPPPNAIAPTSHFFDKIEAIARQHPLFTIRNALLTTIDGAAPPLLLYDQTVVRVALKRNKDYEWPLREDDDDDARVAEEVKQALLQIITAFDFARHSTKIYTKVYFSERYWHRAVYWLCDILTLICSQFVIRFEALTFQPITSAPCLRWLTKRIHRLDKLDIRVRICAFRWRTRTLLHTKGGLHCKRCALKILKHYYNTTFRNMVSRCSALAIRIFLRAEYIRTYTGTMIDSAIRYCERHTRYFYLYNELRDETSFHHFPFILTYYRRAFAPRASADYWTILYMTDQVTAVLADKFTSNTIDYDELRRSVDYDKHIRSIHRLPALMHLCGLNWAAQCAIHYERS